jgi:hypothetical protein
MIYLKKIIWLFILGIFFSMNNFAQEKTSNHRHSLFINTSWYNFFDGSPTIQTNYTNEQKWLSNGYGLGYVFHSQTNKIYSIGFDYLSFINQSPLTEKTPGEVWERKFLKTNIACSLPIYDNNKSGLFWNVGLSVRVGNELLFGNYKQLTPVFGESFALEKKLLDFGLLTGLNYDIYLGNHFIIQPSVNYLIYPFTFDSKGDIYPWDRNPTWHSLKMSIGLVYNFGSEM